MPSVLTGAVDDAKWDTPSESHEGDPEPRSGWTSGERMIGVGTWEMGWGDDGDGVDSSPLPHPVWGAQPVAPGTLRAVHVVLDGFVGLPTEHVLVTWDDRRETVRLPDGRLRWYFDGVHQGFPRQGEIVMESAVGTLYPRGNRYMDALAVRSLEELIGTVNADEVTSIDEDGTIHFYGEHDDSRGEALCAPDSGIVLRASGVEGVRRWRLEVVAARVLEADRSLLEPADVEPRSF